MRSYGYAFLGAYAESNYNYRDFVIVLGDQKLRIRTPNHDGINPDNHYLRPRSTTQTITDDYGSIWSYTFDSDRHMTRIEPPGGAAPMTIAYNSGGKVQSVTNPAGLWTYAYTTLGNYGTTTVTSPMGRQTYAKYYNVAGYVTETRDEAGKYTYYAYDSGYRLTHVTYPEQNYIDLAYDGRGNVLRKDVGPKPAVGGPVVRETADYDPSCFDRIICNQPKSITDAKLNRTDFEYAPSIASSIAHWGSSLPPWSVQIGTGKPVTISLPSPSVGLPRPQVRNTYTSGLLTRSSICVTSDSCVGNQDEVVTTYDYGGTEASSRLLFGKSVAAQGQTYRTCYGYDGNGRRVSQTPAIAGLASCPATVSPAAAVTATMPSAGTPVVTPTFPDDPGF